MLLRQASGGRRPQPGHGQPEPAGPRGDHRVQRRPHRQADRGRQESGVQVQLQRAGLAHRAV